MLQIDAAADGSTGVAVGAQASETQTLAQGDCTWRDSTGANFVEVSTDAGTQGGIPEGTTPLSQVASASPSS